MKTSMFRDQTGKVSFNKVLSFIVLWTVFVPVTYITVNSLFDMKLEPNNAIILVSIYLIIAMMVVAPAAVKAFIEKSQILDKLKK
jgi:hypothetical protein